MVHVPCTAGFNPNPNPLNPNPKPLHGMVCEHCTSVSVCCAGTAAAWACDSASVLYCRYIGCEPWLRMSARVLLQVQRQPGRVI